MLNKSKFIEILSSLEIKAKDTLLVNSNILNLLIKNRNCINAEEIIDSLIEAVTNKGTLMLPAYNWNFCKGEEFNLKKQNRLLER